MREDQDENFSCGTGLVRKDDDQDEFTKEMVAPVINYFV